MLALLRTLILVIISTLSVTLSLGAFKVIALPDLKSFLQPGYQVVTVVNGNGKVPLELLPLGHGNGLDADTVDGQHASVFAKAVDLGAVAHEVNIVKDDIKNLNAGVTTSQSAINGIYGDVTIVAGTGIAVSTFGTRITVTNTGSGAGSTAGVTALTGGGGVTVSGSTGNVTLGLSTLPYSKLSLTGAVIGTDLAGNITVSTTGDITAGNFNTTGALNVRQIVYTDGTNANTVTLNQGTISASYTLTWPTAQGGVSTFLMNDGSGNLSWATSPGGCATCV